MGKRVDIQLFAEVRDGKKNTWNLAPGPEDPWLYYDSEPMLVPVLKGLGEAYDLPPLPEPRGLPEDVSWAVKQKFTLPPSEESLERAPNPRYSHAGWLSAEELLGYGWDAPVRQTVLVDRDGYRLYLKTGVPDRTFGQVEGAQVVEISNQQMERRLRENDWKPTLKEATELGRRARKIRESLKESLGALEGLGDILTDEGIDEAVDLNPVFYTALTFEQPFGNLCPKFLEAIEVLRSLGEARAVYWLTR